MLQTHGHVSRIYNTLLVSEVNKIVVANGALASTPWRHWITNINRNLFLIYAVIGLK